jgi:hypothetical protein
MMEDPIPLKKVVRYLQLRDCIVGRRASVWPIDHPNIPLGKSARTSIVRSFDPQTGVAETSFSRYEPGQVAEWFERREDDSTRSTYEVKTGAVSMPSQLDTQIKDMT